MCNYSLERMVITIVSVTDRRILKSQEAIKSAFIKLMNEKPFDTITMQDISDHANVGRRTIYHHYSDKFDLLDKLIEEHIDELRRLCKEASDLDFIESNVLWFDYFEVHYSFFSAMLLSKGAPFFRNRFLALVIEELEDEVNVTETNKRSDSHVLWYSNRGYRGILFHQWITPATSYCRRTSRDFIRKESIT